MIHAPIVRTVGGSEIATNAFDGSLDLYANADGSSASTVMQAAGPGTVSSAPFTSFPAIIRYPGRPGHLGGTDIAAVGPPGS